MAQQHKPSSQDAETPPLIEFPCDFVIKIMGLADESFQTKMVSLIQAHSAQFSADNIAHRYSANGKYISLSCTIWVSSQAQLDDIYRALSQHPLVKYAI